MWTWISVLEYELSNTWNYQHQKCGIDKTFNGFQLYKKTFKKFTFFNFIKQAKYKPPDGNTFRIPQVINKHTIQYFYVAGGGKLKFPKSVKLLQFLKPPPIYDKYANKQVLHGLCGLKQRNFVNLAKCCLKKVWARHGEATKFKPTKKYVKSSQNLLKT